MLHQAPRWDIKKGTGTVLLIINTPYFVYCRHTAAKSELLSAFEGNSAASGMQLPRRDRGATPDTL